jgi:iron complex outermembrane receptor protein
LSAFSGIQTSENERLTAFEAGYRNTWTSSFSLDSTIFYNRYRDLVSVEPGATRIETNPAPAHLLVPESFGNGLHGETHGIELFANWKVASFWTLSPGYSFFSMHLHPFAGSQDFTDAAGTEGGSPDHKAQLRSSVSLPWNLQWNASAYFVNRLPCRVHSVIHTPRHQLDLACGRARLHQRGRAKPLEEPSPGIFRP